jgi:hypothetical protein
LLKEAICSDEKERKKNEVPEPLDDKNSSKIFLVKKVGRCSVPRPTASFSIHGAPVNVCDCVVP